MPLNTSIASNSILLKGLGTTTPITIIGGEYEINNSGRWTSANGVIMNDDSVRVRLMSSDKGSTSTETNLMIGGGMGTFRVTTRADAPPPTIVLTSPGPGMTSNSRPLLTYTASAGTVVVTVDGVAVSKVSGDTLDALADGMHIVNVAATDTSGRTGSASVTFTVDTIAPAVSIASPTAKLTNNKTPLLSYTVSDGAVIVKVDGVVVNKVSGDLLDPLVDGLHTVRVEATDAAGNIGVASVDFAVDTVSPTISINPVKSPTKDTDVTISGTRENGAKVAVSVDTPAVVGPISYRTATTWSCTIDSMVKGINTITATASDAAGNTASASKSIMVK
ncbi:MAG TPA: Ig-like domain-containing protein [Nitrospirota bacterium]|nr:Ig-like domain-containing protein [Nitrospirota bacterium]